MSPERKLDQWTAQWSVQALARWTLTIALVLGVLIIVGGAERWQSPSYAAALRFPLAPQSWGVVLGCAGLIGLISSLFGRLRATAICLAVVTIWCLFFGFSLLSAALTYRAAGTTGVPIYAFAAVVSGLLAVVHWKSAEPR